MDSDGDPDVASASSGDNTIAVFTNIDLGIFCEVKEIVDNNAIGARTVVAADLNGDGWLDLASASKDDNSVSWYPNDGTGHFPQKIVISSGYESAGAYSLVASDIDGDGDMDLIVASNANDHVSIWRNIDSKGNFEKTLGESYRMTHLYASVRSSFLYKGIYHSINDMVASLSLGAGF